jgi:adenylate cyclase
MGNRPAVRLPLWAVLTVPFTVILLISSGLVAYFGFKNGTNTASDLTRLLMAESSARVQENLNSFLSIPQVLNEYNLAAMRLKQLDMTDTISVQQQFLAQLLSFQNIAAITYANEQQEFIATAWRPGTPTSSLVLSESTAQTGFTFNAYLTTTQGELGEKYFSLPDYDPRTRPWYQAAVTAGQATWTPIFIWSGGNGIGLDAVTPIHTENGDLLGVLDVSLYLSGISKYLQNMATAQNGNVFIVDNSGLLVASSTILEPYVRVNDELQRIDTLTSNDPFIQSATQRVTDQFGGWSAINNSQQFEFTWAGERSLAEVTPYQRKGLRWWIVVAIPESTYLTPINKHISETLLLIIASLTVSVSLLTLVSWRITHPILRLSYASKAFAGGNWSERVAVNRRDELGDLAGSFNQMADQLQQFTASLQASETRFRTIIETAPLGIAFSRDGLILYENRTYLEMFGYQKPEEVNGLPLNQQIDLQNRDEIHDRVRRPEMGEAVPAHYETTGLRRDGSHFPVAVWITRINFPDGSTNVGFYLDLTERKQAEAMMREQSRLQLELEQQKELSELKSRFVSMASHEFRTPLSAILIAAETLSHYREKLTDELISQRLDKIREHVNHLNAIVEAVLNLARIQARQPDFKPSILNLNTLITSVLDEFRSQPDTKHKILYTCNDPQREVSLDPQLMRQITTNLLSNALKYSPHDKPIDVRLEYIDDAIVFKVSDAGIGIPEADIKHLFEPFHRAANVGAISGTGLGLAITKELVELHGGSIAVESQLKVGTNFTVNIPLKTNRGVTTDTVINQ